MLKAMVWLQVAMAGAPEVAAERWAAIRRDERGQTAAEYLGIVVLVAAIIAALFTQTTIPKDIADAVSNAIKNITDRTPG